MGGAKQAAAYWWEGLNGQKLRIGAGAKQAAT